jgi:hypothetical protein
MMIIGCHLPVKHFFHSQQGDEKGLEFHHQGEKSYRRHPGESREPVSFALKSISWEKAWIPASETVSQT